MNYNRALEILEINKFTLSMETLKRKYRMMALLYHPDKNPAADAQERFQDINAAYIFLVDFLKNEYVDEYESDIDDNDNFYNVNVNVNINSYKDILMQFLRGISENGIKNDGGSYSKSTKWGSFGRDFSENLETNTIFYNVIHKITEKCEEKSLELLGKLSKELLLKTYDILYKYSSIFRISEDFVLKVQKIVEDRLKNDECIILNPTLEDLFAKNMYKLSIDGKMLLVPLWHHELVYEINGADVYIKCIPILADNYEIDRDNNLIIRLQYNINDIIDTKEINVEIIPSCIYSNLDSSGQNTDKSYTGDRKYGEPYKPGCGKTEFQNQCGADSNLHTISERFSYKIPVKELKIMRKQQIVLHGEGIPRINTEDIYNTSRIGDIILDIQIDYVSV